MQVWTMLATYGDLCVGCVLPSALGRIPSRPMEYPYRIATLWNAMAQANEPVRIRTCIRVSSHCAPYWFIATKNGPSGFCASLISVASGYADTNASEVMT